MRLAARVPGGSSGKTAFSRSPSHQRSSAPALAPTLIATIDFHMRPSASSADGAKGRRTPCKAAQATLCLLHRPAVADDERLAGERGGLERGEEEGGFRDVLDRSELAVHGL